MSATKGSVPKNDGVLASLRATPVAARYLLGGILINQLGAFVQTFLVLYLVHKGFPAQRAGLSLAVYSLGAVLGVLLGGELTHRLGARRTIALAMGGSAVLVASLPWLSHPDRYAALLVAVALAGAVTQSYRPAAGALLSDLMPAEHRVMGFSMMRTAMNVGAAIGPLVAAALILVNWDLLFWFDGATALAYALLAAVFLPRDAAGHAPAAGSDEEPDAGRGGYLVVLRDARYLAFLASMLLSALIYVQFMAVLPLKITAEGHPPALYSAVLALSSTTLILCELWATSYVKRWPASLAGGLGTALMALGLAGYGLSAAAFAALASTVVFVSGMIVSGPSMSAHPAKAPAWVKGRYIGASHAVFGLGMTVGPAVGVLLWNHIGNGVWLVCGIVGLVAALCAAVGMPEELRPPTRRRVPVAAGR
jgi:MFS family permease